MECRASCKKALVTGGAGFIDSHMVDRLVSHDWEVSILDNFSSGRAENLEHHDRNSRISVVREDLKNRYVLKDVVKDIDVVFHYAANPEVRVSTTDPETHFNANVVGTFNVLEAIRRNNVDELVFASSSSVYGEPDTLPVVEEASIEPVSVYGASKAACENIIHAYTRLYGIRAIILRYANVVGPRLTHGVVYDFVVKVLRNPASLEILGDGSQIRSYIHIDDTLEATMIACQRTSGLYEVFNVGSEDYLMVRDVADTVVGELDIGHIEYAFRPVEHGIGWLGDVKRVALSIDRIKKLGFMPKYGSREAVRKTAQALISKLRTGD